MNFTLFSLKLIFLYSYINIKYDLKVGFDNSELKKIIVLEL